MRSWPGALHVGPREFWSLHIKSGYHRLNARGTRVCLVERRTEYCPAHSIEKTLMETEIVSGVTCSPTGLALATPLLLYPYPYQATSTYLMENQQSSFRITSLTRIITSYKHWRSGKGCWAGRGISRKGSWSGRSRYSGGRSG